MKLTALKKGNFLLQTATGENSQSGHAWQHHRDVRVTFPGVSLGQGCCTITFGGWLPYATSESTLRLSRRLVQDSRRVKLLLSHPHLAQTFLKTSMWRQLVSSSSKSSLCLSEELRGRAVCIASIVAQFSLLRPQPASPACFFFPVWKNHKAS